MKHLNESDLQKVSGGSLREYAGKIKHPVIRKPAPPRLPDPIPRPVEI